MTRTRAKHIHAVFILLYTLMRASLYTITVLIGESHQLVTQVCSKNFSEHLRSFFGWLELLGNRDKHSTKKLWREK